MTGRIAESAKQQVQKWIAETNLGSLARLPVGSMVPYVGSLDVLADYPEWRLCDGEPLLGELYKDSPFYKEKLPEVHNVFLRGTKEPGKRLVPGGSDAEAHDHRVPHQHGMDHTHKGVTSDGRPKNAPKADRSRCSMRPPARASGAFCMSTHARPETGLSPRLRTARWRFGTASARHRAR